MHPICTPQNIYNMLNNRCGKHMVSHFIGGSALKIEISCKLYIESLLIEGFYL